MKMRPAACPRPPVLCRDVRSAFLIALSFLALSFPIQAQQPVDPAPVCGECQLTLVHQVSLGQFDGPGMIPARPASVAKDSQGRYWVIPAGYLPLVFSPAGRFLAEVGREGAGPGEFRRANWVHPLPGDSVLVYDAANTRATVIGPDLKAARTIRIPGVVSGFAIREWPRSVILNGLIRTPERGGWPLHEADLASSDARILRSFGTKVGEMRPGVASYLSRELTGGAGRPVWSAHLLQYQLSEWGSGGTLQRRFLGGSSWFEGETDPWNLGNPKTPPDPRIRDIALDENGLLWILGFIPAPTWAEAWPERTGTVAPRRGPVEVPASEGPEISLLFGSVIEVLDPVHGRVMVRQAFENRHMLALLPNGHAVEYVSGPFDVPVLNILSLQLHDPR